MSGGNRAQLLRQTWQFIVMNELIIELTPISNEL